ncbi:AAA family ATPase [Candidatus Woesearchaeota archaeon]|nr:AAA family ATPase [Candidatus Woesearchaeota archaeon]|tara:strand:+ start:11046 stop:13064 length:2019 start_codon:yes stop_codon:yes gene_type:complete
MDVSEQIKRFEEFFDQFYKKQLLVSIGKGNNFAVVNFKDILSFDTKLAEELLENPEEIIKAAEAALESLDLPSDIKNFRIRFKDITETQKIMVSDIRSAHIGKLISISGIVRQKSDVRPQVTSSRFECPNCGNVISVLQLENSFREPDKCGCGRKGKFKPISKELVDAQAMVLEESPDELEGGEQPKRLNVFLKEDLVSPITDKRTNPGSRVIVVGVLKEIPVFVKGTKSTRFDLVLEANHSEALEEDFYQIEISKEEEKEILELSQDPEVYEKLVKSIVPSIHGYDRIKEALLLQLLGGVHKKRNDGGISRGDCHMLLVGDPGAGKSAILKRITQIAPKGRYVAGMSSSRAGLTAAVVKDEFLGGWSLEAGALVLSNNGLVAIDEMDKMGDEDRSAMHEALEQQTISVAKANIQATLSAKTTVLAAANPKFGRFDPHGIMAEQIDLPPTLINRFDLIFPIKDIPDPDNDERLAKHILQLQQNPEKLEQEISSELLKKYIAYARQNVFPALTESAFNEIKDFYVQMRNRESTDDRAARSIPISARQLEALVRLAEAHARVRFSDKVTKKDARKAIELLTYCLLQVGLDRETGKIDIDRIATGIGASQRERIYLIREIMQELEEQVGKTIPLEDIQKLAQEKGMSASDVEENIEKLKRSGDVFEPRFGFLSRV